MQLLLLGLFAAIYLHDALTLVVVQEAGGRVRYLEALPGDAWPGLGAGAVLLIVLLPKLLVLGGYWLACFRTRRLLGKARGPRVLNRLEAATATLPMLLLTLFAVDLWAGGLRALRVPLRHTVLIDELLILLPTLLTAVACWAAYYPVDRRLREAAIFREADAGTPVAPLLSRGGYVAMQARHQLGLLLPPLLAVFGWAEALVLLGPDFDGPLSSSSVQWLTPAGVLIVFVGAPLVIRRLWLTRPLPEGEVRDRMLAMCRLHRVRVRELLLWQTGGRMINAAVAGLIPQVRYILLSDGLLDRLKAREIEAVMAHELAHVKLRHLIWMGLAILALLGTLEGAGYALIDALAGPMTEQAAPARNPWTDLNNPDVRMALVSVPAMITALIAFGWVSRRIERQADVFAVKHLAMNANEKQHDAQGRQVFDDDAVYTMIHALQRVSELNHIPASPKSWRQDLLHWRHGTIAWRQDHLRSLVGTPIDHTGVDRVLMRVKFATLIGLAITLLLYFL